MPLRVLRKNRFHYGENSDVDAQKGDGQVFAPVSWIVQRKRQCPDRCKVDGEKGIVHGYLLSWSFIAAPREAEAGPRSLRGCLLRFAATPDAVVERLRLLVA